MIINTMNENNIYDAAKHNGFILKWLESKKEAKILFNILYEKEIFKPKLLTDVARQFFKNERVYLFNHWLDNNTKAEMIDITNYVSLINNKLNLWRY